MNMARLYKTSKNPMQSGAAKIHDWVLEVQPNDPCLRDPLLGWVSAPDTVHEMKMTFRSREAALEYCSKNNLKVTVVPESSSQILSPKSYSDNFCHTKRR